MTFDASRIQSLSKQISSAQNEFKTASRLQWALEEASRPSPFESIRRNIAKPSLMANIGAYQDIAGSGLAYQHRVMRQSLAGSATPLMSKFQKVARLVASHRAVVTQDTPAQLSFPKLQNMNSFSIATLQNRVQSFNKMADLARGLARPHDHREGGVMSAFATVNASLGQVGRLTPPSAFNMIRDVHSHRPPPIVVQVAQAVGEAARVYSGWKPLLDNFKEYSLRDVRTMPVPRGNAWADYAPAPETPDPAPPPEGPSATDQLGKMPDTSIEEVPYQFGGGWRIFQPLENAAHRLLNGPLIVQLLFVDTRNIVVGVVIGGVLFLLFYSS